MKKRLYKSGALLLLALALAGCMKKNGQPVYHGMFGSPDACAAQPNTGGSEEHCVQGGRAYLCLLRAERGDLVCAPLQGVPDIAVPPRVEDTPPPSMPPTVTM